MDRRQTTQPPLRPFHRHPPLPRCPHRQLRNLRRQVQLPRRVAPHDGLYHLCTRRLVRP